ncbi:MAG: HAD hydrolase-like protein [Verrucomicrobia bacterium]|nr:HAD hydrolase-like protein [Verrucomicrobiota bacterium]
MKPFQAVIFDMDGVIVDSEPWHERAFREIFQELGYGETHGIDFRAYIGRSDRALWLDFIERHAPRIRSRICSGPSRRASSRSSAANNPSSKGCPSWWTAWRGITPWPWRPDQTIP